MNTNKVFYILAGVIAVVVFITIIVVLMNIGDGGAGQPVTLQFWGVFDNRSVYDPIIREFQKQDSNIRIVYREFNFEDYERSLISALAAGTGPDIFMFHNTWLPKHGDKITPMPEEFPKLGALMTVKDFQDQFVDVAVQDLIYTNKIFALPLYVDTLALYYNKDILNSAGITRPAQTWEEFNSDVEAITRLDGSGNITQSAAAMGTARNINRSTDILLALMMQSGVKMTDAENSSATFSRNVSNTAVSEIALKYYTDFANPSVRTYTWNDAQFYSIDAFAEGKTAMMFNYSHQIPVLKAKAARLNFGVAPIPQISSSNAKTYANYWTVAVSNSSQAPNDAWRFLIHLTSKDGASNYLNATLRPSARRDLIELQRNDLDLGVFALQALSARSWFQIDNLALESIFADMIDDVNFGRATVREALQNAESRVNVLMSR
ncbi:MAG: extracellular solute-binding protein, partial [Candidatus Paceibacterota bacterium]